MEITWFMKNRKRAIAVARTSGSTTSTITVKRIANLWEKSFFNCMYRKKCWDSSILTPPGALITAPGRYPTHRHSKDTKTQQGHKDTAGTQGHSRDTRTQQGHKDTGTQRHRDTKTQGHKDTGTQRHGDTKTQGHKDTGKYWERRDLRQILIRRRIGSF